MFAELVQEFGSNVIRNMFKPLLLFFYMGFLIPILRVKFEFPKPVYQGLTIYLLLAIGWHGGEELAALEASEFGQACGLACLGFIANLCVGIATYFILRACTRLRKIDAATVAGYYGSDSAGTFVTCVGVLTAANMAFAPYMPVLLAIMEIPGCLVALYLVSRMRNNGMDSDGNMPGEAGYLLAQIQPARVVKAELATVESDTGTSEDEIEAYDPEQAYLKELNSRNSGSSTTATIVRARKGSGGNGHGGSYEEDSHGHESAHGHGDEGHGHGPEHKPGHKASTGELLHEVFFNPGIFLLFAGISIGFIARLQGEKVTASGDAVFLNLFPGLLCLFLLEMGMTASRKLKDLKAAGWPFVIFGLLAPNLFAIFGMSLMHTYGHLMGAHFEVGSYVLFAVLCGAASYIALPAVQRLAIPEASPTLPLAASLGLTFSYNVTIGIPVYMLVAKTLTTLLPVV